MQVRAAPLSRVASACALLLLASNAVANPTGPQVVSGNATINGLGTNNVTVTNGANAVINWQGFSIGAGQTTQFVQPSASSAVLNRVVGPNVSSISGSLTSNGRVFLINPNGALFGSGAQVNTAAFTVSTTNVADAQFLGTGDIGSAALLSTGQLSVSGGDVSISSAGAVTNTGTLTLSGTAATLAGSGTLTGNSGIITTGMNTGSVVFTGDRNLTVVGGTLTTSGNVGVGPTDLALNTSGPAAKTLGSVSLDTGNIKLTSAGGPVGNVTIGNAALSPGAAPVTLAAAATIGPQAAAGPVAPTTGASSARSGGAAATLVQRTSATMNLQKREPAY